MQSDEKKDSFALGHQYNVGHRSSLVSWFSLILAPVHIFSVSQLDSVSASSW